MASADDLDVGRTVALRLTHGDDVIDLYGAVRWCRPGERGGSSQFEVGIAFTEVGQVGAESLWRSLTPYRADLPEG
jgi:hypothetical protein